MEVIDATHRPNEHQGLFRLAQRYIASAAAINNGSTISESSNEPFLLPPLPPHLLLSVPLIPPPPSPPLPLPRAGMFVTKFFEGCVPAMELLAEDKTLLAQVGWELRQYISLMDKVK